MSLRHSTGLSLPLLIGIAACGGGGSGGSDPLVGEGAGDGSAGSGSSSANGVRLVGVDTTLADGSTRSIAFGWDAQGRLLSARLQSNGVLSETRRYDWPDATRFSTREDDVGADGSVDRFLDYSFTPNGQLGGARIEAADGTPIGSIVYSVGDDGTVESRERVEDGLLVRRETYSYGDDGDLESQTIDSDGDGVIDRIRGYEYAENGSVAGTTDSRVDAQAGEQPERTAIWRYERGECIQGWFNSVFRPYCVTFR